MTVGEAEEHRTLVVTLSLVGKVWLGGPRHECRRHGTKVAQRFNAGNPTVDASFFSPARIGRETRPIRAGD